MPYQVGSGATTTILLYADIVGIERIALAVDSLAINHWARKY